jgi:predicted CoA-binding protein
MNDNRLLRAILRESRVIAIVGLSDNPDRPSHGVAVYLQQHGFRIIPVNPNCAEILGEKSYPDLRAIPERVDLVNVFRKAEACALVAADAVAIGVKTLWLQLGVVNQAAQRIAEAAGLQVVMDRCIKIEHIRLRDA